MATQNLTFNIDTNDFFKAVALYSQKSVKSTQEIVKQQSRLIIKNIIDLTPPSNGFSKGSAAKKAGEQTIDNDLTRIFSVIRPEQKQAFIDFNGGKSAKQQFGHRGAKAIGTVQDIVLDKSEIAKFHNDRRKSNGRVKGGKGGAGMTNRSRAMRLTTGLKKSDLIALDVGYITPQEKSWYSKLLKKRVGFLASGWNAAASAVGLKLPTWINRHGSQFGDCSGIKTTSEAVSIKFSNYIKYGSNAKNLDKRVQKAIDKQTTKLLNQLMHMQKQQSKL